MLGTQSRLHSVTLAPALDYCLTTERTDDPRRVIAVCKCGRERLLNGECQRTLTATMNPEMRARLEAEGRTAGGRAPGRSAIGRTGT